MLMHQNSKSELEFGKESLGISSDSSSISALPTTTTTTTLSLLSPDTKIQTQLIDPQTQTTTTTTTPNKTHFPIQVSSSSSSSSSQHHPPNQTQQSDTPHPCHHHHHHEHEQPNNNNNNNNNNPSSSSPPPPSQTPLSSPHKRPIMNSHPLSSSPLSPPSPCHNHTQDSPFQTPFVARFQPLKLLTQPQFRFLIFLSLPSLYFLLSNPLRSLPLDLYFLITFSALLLFSLNLALPRLPSIRLFLARSLPTKLSSSFSTTNPNQQPVLWSIGSKDSKPNNKNLKVPSSGFYVQVYSNGDVYEGEFHKAKCSGSGVYHYHMSGRYEGDWVDGRYDGFGVETWARGSRYRGQYRQGLRHGVGIYRFFSGDVYAGEWSNGQCHGFGVHTCSDGSRYVGEFKWGVKHGLGQYHFRNGDIYAGEYFADMMHGFGVYKFQNGHQYEGAWHEGRRQGLGKYTFRNGETQCGHWQNGILDDPKMLNSHAGSPCAVDHTKVFNAVKDAQCAAEKAYNLGKVDVGVNQVVALANKAANAARVSAVKAVQSRMHHNNNDK